MGTGVDAAVNGGTSESTGGNVSAGCRAMGAAGTSACVSTCWTAKQCDSQTFNVEPACFAILAQPG